MDAWTNWEITIIKWFIYYTVMNVDWNMRLTVAMLRFENVQTVCNR